MSYDIHYYARLAQRLPALLAECKRQNTDKAIREYLSEAHAKDRCAFSEEDIAQFRKDHRLSTPAPFNGVLA